MYTLKIEYIYEDGVPAFRFFEQQFLEGETFSIDSPPAPEGYIVDYPRISGMMKAQDMSITVTYTAIPTIPTP